MRLVSYLLILLVCFGSCRTQRAVYNYLEDVKDTSFKKSVYLAEPVIQKNDLLSIQVTSASLDEKVNQPYNQNIQGAQLQGNTVGYLVDVYGNIVLPTIGKIHVEGLSKSALEDTIKNRLLTELTGPNAQVRFINFRITVLGEVGAPGVLTIPTERLTILEAVGMAGGVTQFGMIKDVKILRERNGIRELGKLDLTSQSIFGSPYYQLQQNDVILVDQNRYKLRQTEQTRISQQLGFALSIITSIALLYNIFK